MWSNHKPLIFWYCYSRDCTSCSPVVRLSVKLRVPSNHAIVGLCDLTLREMSVLTGRSGDKCFIVVMGVCHIVSLFLFFFLFNGKILYHIWLLWSQWAIALCTSWITVWGPDHVPHIPMTQHLLFHLPPTKCISLSQSGLHHVLRCVNVELLCCNTQASPMLKGWEPADGAGEGSWLILGWVFRVKPVPSELNTLIWSQIRLLLHWTLIHSSLWCCHRHVFRLKLKGFTAAQGQLASPASIHLCKVANSLGGFL